MDAKISILAPFFRHPHTGFHIREIARITGINHTTVRKYLQLLEKEGYLVFKKTKPYTTYKSNSYSRKYLYLKLYYNLERLRESGIIEKLETAFDHPTLILFGSFAKALDDENSDIDFCVLSQAKPRLDLSLYEEFLGRKVSIHLFDKRSWENSKKKNPELINSICNGIVVSGQLEVL